MEQYHSKADLDHLVEEACAKTRDADTAPEYVGVLGIALQKRFLASLSQADLDDGLDNLETALVQLAHSDGLVPALLNSCSILVQIRAVHENCLPDALIAVALAQTAVNLYVPENDSTWYCKLHLCRAYIVAHELSAKQNWTGDVLGILDELLPESPDLNARRLCQGAKADALRALYKWTGDDLVAEKLTADLNFKAYETEIIKSFFAQSYGESYLAIFEKSGIAAKLSIAQGLFQIALQCFHNVYTPGTHPYESLLLRLCGCVAMRMFSLTHVLPHNEAAKKFFRSAVRQMSRKNVLRPQTIVDYALAIQLSAIESSGTLSRNRQEFAAIERVLKAELKRSDLSMSYRRKFSRLLQESVRFAKEHGSHSRITTSVESEYSLEVACETLSDPDIAPLQMVLLRDRVQKLKISNDKTYSRYRTLALKFEKTMVHSSSDAGNPAHKVFLGGLEIAANLLYKVFDARQERELGLKAGHVCFKMMLNRSFDAARRLSASVMAAMCFLKCADDAGDSAVRCIKFGCVLMPHVVPIGLQRLDQLALIRKVHSTPKLAASIFIASNETLIDTIAQLERTRSMIWEQLVTMREPFEQLQTADRSLAVRWRELQENATAAERATGPMTTSQDPLVLQDRLLTLNQDVRRGSPNHAFLGELTEIEIQSLTHEGPIIFLNVTELRTDAIVLCSEEHFSVHLQNAGLSSCKEQYLKLKQLVQHWKDGSASREHFNTLETSMKEVLLWLWTAIAEPILNAPPISSYIHSGRQKPRVWWVASSWANLLPLHAAGNHERALATGIPCSVLDLTESSYIPTLRALKEARKTMKAYASRQMQERPRSLLIVMPNTPDRNRLPNTITEIDTIQPILQNHSNTHILLEPTTSEVLDRLKTSQIVHIASHCETDNLDPLRSQLLLRDYSKNPLNVQILSKLQLSCCQLVYLSACETTVNQDIELLDEGIHVSGGFQMAGVPNTMSTWWTVADDESVDVSKWFYRGLVSGEKGVDVGRCAKSLCETVLRMRREGKNPFVWAAYSHSGA